LTEEWILPERTQREQGYLGALEVLALRALAEGAFGAAEKYLRQVVAIEPLRESAQRSLMQTLASGGNHTAATQVYRELRALLEREYSAEPDPQTEALARRLGADTWRS
jgi:DNA-binding SARP family transcriptional activator